MYYDTLFSWILCAVVYVMPGARIRFAIKGNYNDNKDRNVKLLPVYVIIITSISLIFNYYIILYYYNYTYSCNRDYICYRGLYVEVTCHYFALPLLQCMLYILIQCIISLILNFIASCYIFNWKAIQKMCKYMHT